MQQHAGGSQYGIPAPEMAPPFSSAGAGPRQPFFLRISAGADYSASPQQQQQHVTEAASPVSCRLAPTRQEFILDEICEVVSMSAGLADEDACGAGDEVDRAGAAGNRWPRQEALALLKIRSDMDDAFRGAVVKGPLWEDVSRKLADLGYRRSAKKCKEKFENVQKYYKRTKEARAGRQDGKSYRFFSELEALYSGSNATAASCSLNACASPNLSFAGAAPSGAVCAGAAPSAIVQPTAVSTTAPSSLCVPAQSRSASELATSAAAGISLSSNASFSSSGSEGDNEEEGAVAAVRPLRDGSRKRKRKVSTWGSRKIMAFFQGLMKQMLERQEGIQQRFLDTIERREQERMVREDAWKLQEMARLNREYELMAQERTMAANRDAAVISFLHKFSATTANQPLLTTAASGPQPQPSPVAAPQPTPPQQEKRKAPPARADSPVPGEETSLPSSDPLPLCAVSGTPEAMAGTTTDTVSPSMSLSRWPKSEVIALIKLRSGLDARYVETGPKGPLWEEISAGMKQQGYNRSAKRCKEKWENINKYFKKVKESNKKRPEDAKTCSYFHELDTLYRKKQLGSGANNQLQHTTPNANRQQLGQLITFPALISGRPEKDGSIGKQNPTTIPNCGAPRCGVGGLQQLFVTGATKTDNGATPKENHLHRVVDDYDKLVEAADSDTLNIDEDDDDEEEDGEDGKLRYEIQFQRQGMGGGGGAHAGSATGRAEAVAPAPGSFLAVQ